MLNRADNQSKQTLSFGIITIVQTNKNKPEQPGFFSQKLQRFENSQLLDFLCRAGHLLTFVFPGIFFFEMRNWTFRETLFRIF